MKRRGGVAVGIAGLLILLAAPAQAHVGEITQFPAPAFTRGIAIAPDGALWFTESNEVVRRGLDGTLTRYPISRSRRRAAIGITAGPRDSMWFAEGSSIGRVTRSGDVKRYRLPDPDSGAQYLTAGPDGNLWFTESAGNAIGRLTPTGALTEFPIPTFNAHPWGIAAGPDGNLWFTEFYGGSVGRISTDGVVTEFATSGGSSAGITVGPDGALWFTEPAGNTIGRLTTTGALTEFQVPAAHSTPIDLATGSDGEIWFTEHDAGAIGRVSTDGSFEEFPIEHPTFGPWGIAAGPDGNLWFTETNVSHIARITVRPSAMLVVHPSGGPPDTAVAVSGSGFGSFERVRIHFADAAGARTGIGHAITDASGRFEVTVVIPPGAPAGSSQIRAHGTVSGIRRSGGFTVTAPRSGGQAGRGGKGSPAARSR